MINEEENVTNNEEAPVNEEVSEVSSSTPSEKPKRKRNKVVSIIGWVFTVLFVGLFIFVGIGQIKGMVDKQANYGQSLTYDYGSFVIKTDSMEPDYPVGIAIITHKDDPVGLYQYYLQHKQEIVDETSPIDITFHDSYSGGFNYPENPELTERTSNLREVMTHRLREIQYYPEVAYGDGQYIFIVSGTNIGGHMAASHQFQAFSERELLGVVKIKSNILGGFFGFISSPWGLLVFLLIPAFYLVITSVLDIFKAMKDPEEVKEGEGNVAPSDNTPSSLDSLSAEDRERLKREMLDEIMNNKKGNKK